MEESVLNINEMIVCAQKGVETYLEDALKQGAITEVQYKAAQASVMPNFREWMLDPKIDELSPNLKAGVAAAVAQGRWEDIVNAYRQNMRFGTGGIRGMMAFDRDSIVKLKEEGLDAPILKGPNTLNNIVVLKVSAGVAQFGKSEGRNFEKIVIGYDSRVRGGDFARLIAELFLAYGYTVYLFDEPCPYPEVTFAIPYKEIRAQVGLLISASHNDYRYNGYKLSSGNGSQFDPEERDIMYEAFISKATTSDIKLLPLNKAASGQLYFLGGSEPIAGVDYYGCNDMLIDVHHAHAEHVKHFIMNPQILSTDSESNDPLHIGYCAFHGAGRKAMPRMLQEVGLYDIKPVTRNGLNDLDGLFPSFCSDPGREQQPDPGDRRAAKIAVNAFKLEYPGEFESKTDILIGTDPDADRCGIVVKPTEAQRSVVDGQDWVLLPADEMWALLLWYRFDQQIEKYGRIPDVEKQFVVLSHTTTDAIVKLAQKYGVGVVRTWVGFASLSAAVRDAWDGVKRENLFDGRVCMDADLCHPFVMEYIGMDDQRKINVGAMEQSNGFSLLGGPPPDRFSLGENGHVRDKDGAFAGLLCAEVAKWAKLHSTTLFELIDDKIYLDPDIGLFTNYYEPDPLDGEYPGIEGDRKKLSILHTALDLYREVKEHLLERRADSSVMIADSKVVSAAMYRTGKYDKIYPSSRSFVFPDEGLRFFFSEDRLSHLTVRPSGTGNSLRFHVQLHCDVKNAEDLPDLKKKQNDRAVAIVDDIRSKLGAPR